MGKIKEELLYFDIAMELQYEIRDKKENIDTVGFLMRDGTQKNFNIEDIIEINTSYIKTKIEISPTLERIYIIPLNNILYTWINLRSAKQLSN